MHSDSNEAPPQTGVGYPWPAGSTAMLNHFYTTHGGFDSASGGKTLGNFISANSFQGRKQRPVMVRQSS